jgi:hypothetical protein
MNVISVTDQMRGRKTGIICLHRCFHGNKGIGTNYPDNKILTA